MLKKHFILLPALALLMACNNNSQQPAANNQDTTIPIDTIQAADDSDTIPSATIEDVSEDTSTQELELAPPEDE